MSLQAVSPRVTSSPHTEQTYIHMRLRFSMSKLITSRGGCQTLKHRATRGETEERNTKRATRLAWACCVGGCIVSFCCCGCVATTTNRHRLPIIICKFYMVPFDANDDALTVSDGPRETTKRLLTCARVKPDVAVGGAGRGAEDSVGLGRGQITAETRAQSDAAMRFDCNCAREIVKDGGEEL